MSDTLATRLICPLYGSWTGARRRRSVAAIDAGGAQDRTTASGQTWPVWRVRCVR